MRGTTDILFILVYFYGDMHCNCASLNCKIWHPHGSKRWLRPLEKLVEVAEATGVPCRLSKMVLRKWGDVDVIQHFPKVVLGMVKETGALIRAY